MLDIKKIRKNPDAYVEALSKRHGEFPIDELLATDERRRELLVEVENKRAEQNRVSKSIPQLKKEGKDISETLASMKVLSEEVKSLDKEVRQVEENLKDLLLHIPNVPNELVPEGTDDSENVELRKYGTPTEFDFEPKAHWDLGTDLGILDFERATKISGTRFTVFSGDGARLERALMNFMLNLHTTEHGFREMGTPFMVNRESMIGTGQLPKFESDMFYLPQKDFFMVPTAEVPLTNLCRDEILREEDLPMYMCAYTPCFRLEAGSAGRDTRGLIRNHQFDKVELVKYSLPENSYEELESLTACAEEVLKRLELPYRVVRLCSGDLGFSSAMTYDIEVWMPSYGRYVEISSCSNFEDYQARRANIRYRKADNSLEFVHTLNGSGLAIGRTFAAVIENYQREDGSIEIPEALRPYFGKDEIR